MAQVLIVYSSRYGQTAKICFHMARYIQRCGLIVDTVDIQTPLSLNLKQYDAVLIGTPIYIGKSNFDLINWVIGNRNELQKKVTGFFTVSLNAADQRPAARKNDRRLIQEFIEKTRWIPDMSASFSGALHYPAYNFLLKILMKFISKSAGGPTHTSQKYELTNWKTVESFTENFLEQVKLKSKNRLLPINEYVTD